MCVADHELAGVGPPIGAHRRGLGPHDPGAAGAEPPPPPAHQVGRGRRRRPPSHPSIGSTQNRLAASRPATRERLGERAARIDLGVDGEVEPEVGDAAGELGGGPQRADLHDVDLGAGTFHHGGRL